MTEKVKTLDSSLKEARALAAMYRDLLTHGEAREQEITDEIAVLEERRSFLKRARDDAPNSLSRARDRITDLEVKRRESLLRGDTLPSRATLQRKADRVETLAAELRVLASKLRAQGLDPRNLI